MPYLQGYSLEDASAAAMADASAVPIAEPNVDFGGIVQGVQSIVTGKTGTGLVDDVFKVAGNVLDILGYVVNIYSGMAQQTTLENIDTAVDNVADNTISIISKLNGEGGFAGAGLLDLKAAILAIGGEDSRDLTVVYNQIPTDFSGVWTYLLPNSGGRAADVLDDAGGFARNMSDIAMHRLTGNPCFGVSGSYWDPTVQRLIDVSLTMDWTDYTPGESLLTWLNRVTGCVEWEKDVGSDYYHIHAYDLSYDNDFQIYFLLSEVEWRAVIASQNGSASEARWPGLDNVTLGTPVALSEGVTIAEAMDGILIALTSIPPKTGSYTFDDKESYLHMGAVAFYSDNGDYEQAQSFSFVNHILMPKSIAHPAGCVLRCKGNTVGTATPFTINT